MNIFCQSLGPSLYRSSTVFQKLCLRKLNTDQISVLECQVMFLKRRVRKLGLVRLFIERFHLGMKSNLRLLWHVLHFYVIWLVKKDSRYYFIQSEVKPKPTVTRLHSFFPRIAFATRIYCEFLLFLWIVCSLWNWPEWIVWSSSDTQLKTALKEIIHHL